ncbi:MAG: TIGR03862 family flavoprotein [Burkholderiales bacterium]|nr:TIGR03862 family flavoprotein [Burkholderiales bacterium]
MPRPLSHACVIGAGPAGLAAAECLSAAGCAVDLYDAMPSVGRKFLLAGRGGLNLTHGEPYERFVTRFTPCPPLLRAALDAFPPQALRDWCEDLGIATFVGSSNRVFPLDLKAAPLLRAWLRRLHAQGVRLHSRHRWLGWTTDGALHFATPAGEVIVPAAPTLLALGGASWPRLGSDGAWQTLLHEAGVAQHPLRPSNCGFDVQGGWSTLLRERHAGEPIKPVALSFAGRRQAGEFVLTETGVEGSLIYAFSALLREAIAEQGSARLELDLLPQHSAEQVRSQLARGQGSKSLSSFLKSQFKLSAQKLALLHEARGELPLAEALKALPLVLAAPRPIAEAISSAGGIAWEALDAHWQLQARPGVYACGEMLDWEAPTGGYLLNACIATGRAAAQGMRS